jgi:hypothetical protein
LGFLADECTLAPLNQKLLSSCKPFSCNDSDLDDFFTNDCQSYSEKLLGKSYCFTLNSDPSTIVCSFSVSNDSIKTNFIPKSKKNKLERKIPQKKKMRSYPAVLIGRLGVDINFRDKKIGDDCMDFIKSWFINSKNKTGCRYIVVDAYNKEKPIKYYKRNGFEFLFDNEDEEKIYAGLRSTLTKKQLFINYIRNTLRMKPIIVENLHTRLMYFDLIYLKP